MRGMESAGRSGCLHTLYIYLPWRAPLTATSRLTEEMTSWARAGWERGPSTALNSSEMQRTTPTHTT